MPRLENRFISAIGSIGVGGDNKTARLLIDLEATIDGSPTAEWVCVMHLQTPTKGMHEQQLTILDGATDPHVLFELYQGLIEHGEYHFTLHFLHQDGRIKETIPATFTISSGIDASGAVIDETQLGIIDQLILEVADHETRIYALEQGGGGGGTTNYELLTNLPQINSHVLKGDQTAEDLGLTMFDGIHFDTVEPMVADTPGDIAFNATEGTFDMHLLDGVTLQAGQEFHIFGKATGAIANGDIVQFVGAQGNHITFKKAVPAEINANPQYLLGVATENIASGAFGYVTRAGNINGVFTPGWTVGQTLYYDNTTGGITNVTPSNGIKYFIGMVISAATGGAENGKIYVDLMRIYGAADVGADAAGTAQALVSAHNLSGTAHNDIRTALGAKADLIDGVVPASQLPSYVDDVLEYASAAAFPAVGTAGKIYVALDTNLTYRWGGSAYVEISASLALGENATTAYRGDRGKIAYDHSQSAHAPADAEKNVQSDWNNLDPASDAFILNKPASMAPTAHKTTHAKGGSDALTPADIEAEPALGSPSTDGYVLTSTAAGVRTWGPQSAGGGSTYPRGTAFPASPTAGDVFYRTDRKVLYLYENNWQPIESYGSMRLYANATTGNDANGGFASNDAKATLQGVFDAIPRIYGGDIVIEIVGVFAATATLAGKYSVNGAQISMLSYGGATLKEFTATGDETLAANRGLLSAVSGAAMVANAYAGKLLANRRSCTINNAGGYVIGDKNIALTGLSAAILTDEWLRIGAQEYRIKTPGTYSSGSQTVEIHGGLKENVANGAAIYRVWYTTIFENSTSTIRTSGSLSTYYGRTFLAGDTWEVKEQGASTTGRLNISVPCSLFNIKTGRVSIQDCRLGSVVMRACNNTGGQVEYLKSNGGGLYDHCADSALGLYFEGSGEVLLIDVGVKSSATAIRLDQSSSVYALDVVRILGAPATTGFLVDNASRIKTALNSGWWIKNCTTGISLGTFCLAGGILASAPDFTGTTTQSVTDTSTANGVLT